MTREELAATRRKASELIANAISTTHIEVVRVLRHFVVRIAFGIVPGLQCEKFEDQDEAMQWAVEMYNFYSSRGWRVKFRPSV